MLYTMVFHGRLVQIEVTYLGTDVLEDGLDKQEGIKQDIVKDSLRPQTWSVLEWVRRGSYLMPFPGQHEKWSLFTVNFRGKWSVSFIYLSIVFLTPQNHSWSHRSTQTAQWPLSPKQVCAQFTRVSTLTTLPSTAASIWCCQLDTTIWICLFL